MSGDDEKERARKAEPPVRDETPESRMTGEGAPPPAQDEDAEPKAPAGRPSERDGR
ncbi:hypothetical protein GCM10020229_38290 [Kitasatospora albolonga]|uniref:hypothetical protein n=1 Tax=Kitasatospora albolonga TaxID=68173 RepID=UPI0031F0734A